MSCNYKSMLYITNILTISLIFSFVLERTPLFAIDRVRVDCLEGVPTITIDGKPVRSRIFWGGHKEIIPTVLTSEWKEYSFEFIAQDDSNGEGTLHLRFSKEPGEIVLDDISVIEVESGREVLFVQNFENENEFKNNWQVWPSWDNSVGQVEINAEKGYQQSGGLVISISEPDDGMPSPDFHLYSLPKLVLKKGLKYRVFYRARSPQNLELYHAFYRPGTEFCFLGNDDATDYFSNQIRWAAEAGVDFVSFTVPCPWPEPGKNISWNSVDKICEQVLRANPNALLIPRYGLDPPEWWIKANPEHVIKWEGNTHPTRFVAAVSSPLYRQEAAVAQTRLIEHLEKKFGPHIAGYHPCGQNTGEWFYQDTWNPCYSGYSQADLRAWREWLDQKYPSDTDLQKAWGDQHVTHATAVVPTLSQRQVAREKFILNASPGHTDCFLYDFHQFQQDMMAETILTFAHAAREASHGNRMIVLFYGYLFEFGHVANGPAVSGHYALQKVLQSPDIDILCSPISYYDRAAGGTGPAMTAAESVLSSGKMWLFEDDTRTYLTRENNFPGFNEGGNTYEETADILLRNTSQCALRNFGTWWMDLGSSGWFDDEKLWEEMKRLNTLDQYFLEHPVAYEPEIAAFIDESSAIAFPNNSTTSSTLYFVRSVLGRIGAPYGQYLLDDFISGKSNARLNIFLNPCLLTSEKRATLAKKTEGTFAVWGFASGYLDSENGPSSDAMKQLTGFNVQPVSEPDVNLTLTQAGIEFGLTESWGQTNTKNQNDLRFTVTDALPEEILATYSDGKPAIALRSTEQNGWSLFLGIPEFNTSLLRAAARKAGVHLYTDSDCNVYANGPFLSLHGATDAPVSLNLKEGNTLTDLFTKQTIGKGPSITIPLRKGETKIFCID